MVGAFSQCIQCVLQTYRYSNSFWDVCDISDGLIHIRHLVRPWWPVRCGRHELPQSTRRQSCFYPYIKPAVSYTYIRFYPALCWHYSAPWWINASQTSSRLSTWFKTRDPEGQASWNFLWLVGHFDQRIWGHSCHSSEIWSPWEGGTRQYFATGHYVWRPKSSLSDIFENRRTCPTWPADFGKPGRFINGLKKSVNFE